MKVTTKGQVTIPLEIRTKLGIDENSEVEFIQEKGKVYINKKSSSDKYKSKLEDLRGIANTKLSTDEIMSLTRKK